MTGMEQAHSVTSRQPSYFIFWTLWFLATAGYGVVWAAVIYFWGTTDAFSFYFPLFGGLWLGILQGLVLRHYFILKGWWKWIISSSIGWFGAMLILVIGIIPLLGTGVNNVDPNGASIRGCEIGFCGLAGAAFGAVQAVFSQIRFDAAFWMATNAFTWAVGGLVAGIVGLAMYGPIPVIVRYLDSSSPEGVLSAALGVLTAMLVIGAVTGVAAAWQVWIQSKTLL